MTEGARKFLANLTKVVTGVAMLMGVFTLVTLALSNLASASTTLTSNRTVLGERGGNVSFTSTVTTGYAPFFFDFYKNGNLAEIFQSNVSSYTWVTPVHSSAYYFAEASGIFNGTYAYNESSEIQISVNSTPVLHLFPSVDTIDVYANVTFSNTITGGSAPYRLSNYTVVGGRYSILNNTITFEDTGIYDVSLTAKDNESMNSTATSQIDVAYIPTVNLSGNCTDIYNLSQTERFSFAVNGINMQGVENYITPDYAGVTLNNIHLQNLYPNEIVPFSNDALSVEVINLSWIPILDTISIQICPYSASLITSTTTIPPASNSIPTNVIIPANVVNTTTTTSTSSTTSTTSITTTMPTTSSTTTIPPTTTQPMNSSSPTTATSPNGIAISEQGQANPYGIFILMGIVIVGVAYMIYRKVVVDAN